LVFVGGGAWWGVGGWVAGWGGGGGEGNVRIAFIGRLNNTPYHTKS